MSSHADVRDMIAPYALGALDRVETVRIEEHLSECGFCANLAREATEVAHYLSYAAPTLAPPATSLDRLLASIDGIAATAWRDNISAPDTSPHQAGGDARRRRIGPGLDANAANIPAGADHGDAGQGRGQDRSEATEPAGHSRFGWARWLRSPTLAPLAACIVLVLALAGWNFSLMGEVQSEHTEMTGLHHRLAEQARLLVMVMSGSAVTKPLQGTALAPSAQVRLIMDSESNSAMVMASELPPLPPDRVYQVWLGRQGARMPAGRLTVDQQGDGECNLQLDGSVHSYDSAWITLEPAQGGPLPNSPGVARGLL